VWHASNPKLASKGKSITTHRLNVVRRGRLGIKLSSSARARTFCLSVSETSLLFESAFEIVGAVTSNSAASVVMLTFCFGRAMVLVSCVSAWYQAYFILLRWRIFQGYGAWVRGCVGAWVRWWLVCILLFRSGLRILFNCRCGGVCLSCQALPDFVSLSCVYILVL